MNNERRQNTSYHLANPAIYNVNASILMKKVIIGSDMQIEMCVDWLIGAVIDESDNIEDYEVNILNGNLSIHCKNKLFQPLFWEIFHFVIKEKFKRSN